MMRRGSKLIPVLATLAIGVAGLLFVSHVLGQPANALPALTPTLTAETPTPVFSATLSLDPSAATLIVGEVLTITADLSVVAGCQYPIFELSMHESDELPAIFAPIEPPIGIITGPIQLPSAWTFRAIHPGTTTFKAQTFGERYCDDYWNWHYEYATSLPITILAGDHLQFNPIIIED